MKNKEKSLKQLKSKMSKKYLEIDCKDSNDLELFLATLYAVAKDMQIKVETIRIKK